MSRAADALCPPLLTTVGGEGGEQGREAYKLDIKTALLITLIMLVIREMKRNTQGRNGSPRGWVPRAPASSCRAAPGSPGLAPATDRDWT